METHEIKTIKAAYKPSLSYIKSLFADTSEEKFLDECLHLSPLISGADTYLSREGILDIVILNNKLNVVDFNSNKYRDPKDMLAFSFNLFHCYFLSIDHINKNLYRNSKNYRLLMIMSKVGEAVAYGDKKYEKDSWKKLDPRTYFDAWVRHLNSIMTRDIFYKDKDSGLLHLSHLTINAIYHYWFCV